jgi:hypothetical protein
VRAISKRGSTGSRAGLRDFWNEFARLQRFDPRCDATNVSIDTDRTHINVGSTNVMKASRVMNVTGRIQRAQE